MDNSSALKSAVPIQNNINAILFNYFCFLVRLKKKKNLLYSKLVFIINTYYKLVPIEFFYTITHIQHEYKIEF